MSSSSICPIDRTLSGFTIPGESGPGSNSNEEVLHITQASRTAASLSDCLVSYLELSLRDRSYSSAEMQSVYSTAPADRDRPYQVLSLQVRVDLGIMAMKWHSTLPRAPGLELQHQMV